MEEENKNQINDITDIDKDSENGIEKKPKQKRQYQMTEARKLAWERCLKARQEKTKQRQEDKLVKAAEIIKKKKKVEIEPEVKTIPKESEINEVKETKKRGRKTKKVIVYESSSDSDSDDSIEIEVKRKSRKKTPQQPIEEPQPKFSLNEVLQWL